MKLNIEEICEEIAHHEAWKWADSNCEKNVRLTKEEHEELTSIKNNLYDEYHRLISNLSLRRSGRTTRLADEGIQNLFKYGECYIKDHYQKNYLATINLYNIIMNRLVQEHGITEEDLEYERRGDYLRIILKNW